MTLCPVGAPRDLSKNAATPRSDAALSTATTSLRLVTPLFQEKAALLRPNAHVQLQGAFSSKAVILILNYLMLGHNLMQVAPVCCNM